MAEAGAGRWAEVERLYHEALGRDAATRGEFLIEACRGDDALRAEVWSLLAYESAAGDFLTHPALEQVARQSPPARAGSLTGQQIHGYQVRSLLGAGGMGEVYLARDLRLGRDVALKVLQRSVAGDPGYIRRFEDEARSASVLNHPNIVTIYGVGEEGDISYIAMERVNGRTLREIIASADLAVPAVLDLAIQLADALAAAHANGIVHRDLKPDNVMVTPEGLLKVLDFGIAKRQGTIEGPTLTILPGQRAALETEVGTILGTVGYMSPEQAAGVRATAASDVFSCGAILYELLTGRRAFERDTKVATLSAIRHESPASIQSLNANVTPPLRRVVDRCLAKDPEQRFTRTPEVGAALRAIRERLTGGGLSRRQAIWFGVAATAAATSAVVGWRFWPSGPRVQSLAVLPFVNTDRDPEADHLCQGLTNALIQQIGPLPSIRVAPRTLVANLKGRTDDPRAIGREIGVESVLTGEIRRRPDRLIISATLVEVASGKRLWSNTYDRAASDLIGVQAEIASAIVDDGVRLQLTTDDHRRLTSHETDSPEAYDLYLRAVYLNEQPSQESYLRQRDLLQQALARDGRFARAYAKLAGTYSAMAVEGYESPIDAGPRQISNTRQALDHDPDLPDAHAEAASWEFFFNWNWANAEEEWTRAARSRYAEIDPQHLIPRAVHRWALGRSDEALRFIRDARALDRLSPVFMLFEGDYLVQTGQFEPAVALYESATRAEATAVRAHHGIADARRAQGRFDEAIDAFRRAYAASAGDSLPPVLASAHGAEGYQAIERYFAQAQLEDLKALADAGAYTSPLEFARVYARLGEKARAFTFLSAALAERSPGLVFLNVDRYWDSLRTDPIFRDAVQRVGLPH